MLTRDALIVIGYSLMVVHPRLIINYSLLTTLKKWHFRHDWLFTPFVVVVGCKYFLPVPECLLFDRVPEEERGSLPGKP